MNAKSISQNEAQQILKQQIVTLEKKTSKGEFDIREIGDYLPGNVMVQDLDKLSNIYMNKSGCDILMHSLEELEELGPSYYTNFFPQEEFVCFIPALLVLKDYQDKTRSHNFFQRVRPNHFQTILPAWIRYNPLRNPHRERSGQSRGNSV